MWGQISNAFIAMWGRLLADASAIPNKPYFSRIYDIMSGNSKHTNFSHIILVINKLIFLKRVYSDEIMGGDFMEVD